MVLVLVLVLLLVLVLVLVLLLVLVLVLAILRGGDDVCSESSFFEFSLSTHEYSLWSSFCAAGACL